MALRLLKDVVDERERILAARDGDEAMEMISDHRPDIILLDIHMPGTDGLMVSRQLNGQDAPAVVFVTAYSHHAAEAFEEAAVDYLLKPVKPERLDIALTRTRSMLRLQDAQSKLESLAVASRPSLVGAFVRATPCAFCACFVLALTVLTGYT